MPEFDVAGPDEDREDERLRHRERLGAQDEVSLRHPVGDDAREEDEDRDWQELEHRHGTEGDLRIGDLQDEPCLGNRLHPGAA